MRIRWEFIVLVLLLVAAWSTATEPRDISKNQNQAIHYPPALSIQRPFPCKMDTFGKKSKQIAKENRIYQENKIGKIRAIDNLCHHAMPEADSLALQIDNFFNNKVLYVHMYDCQITDDLAWQCTGRRQG